MGTKSSEVSFVSFRPINALIFSRALQSSRTALLVAAMLEWRHFVQSQYLYFPASATGDVAVFGRNSGFGGTCGLSDAVLRMIAARCTCGPSL